MADQGTVYAEFVRAELQAENDRRNSINDRAGAALTGAGGLVTLVLAVFAALTGTETLVLTDGSRMALAVALLALLSCAFCAVIAGLPWRFRVSDADTLRAMVNEHWGDDEVDARNITADLNTRVLLSLRSGTSIKVGFLIGAAGCQMVAIGALGVCTFVVLGITDS